MLEEVPEGYRTQEGLTNEESGGMVVPTLGRSLFIWTYWEDYGGVEKAGAHQLWIAKQGNGNTDWRGRLYQHPDEQRCGSRPRI